jgi:hypothetical protein
VLLAQACGSSDGKKKTMGPQYAGGGEGGESSGGSKPTGGKDGSGGVAASGNDGGQTGADAGNAGTPGTVEPTAGAGPEATGGAGGAVGSGDDCPTGFGECDDNPLTVCEQDLNLVTSCGDCKTTCNSTHATVACEGGGCVVKSCNAGFADCSVDASANDACETSIVNNNAHCGSCARDCAAVGSTCATDKCNEIPLQQAQPIGSDSGVNRTWAFSPLGLLHVGFNSYAVRRFPLNNDPTLVVWNSTNKTAGRESLLVQGTDVYWSELGTGGDDFTSAVFYKPITDAADTLKKLAWVPEWHVQFLRQQGNAFYWFSGDYQSGDPGAWIYTRAIGPDLNDHGTRIMTVDQGTHDGIVDFNVTSDALYWISTHALTGTAYELRTTPLAGGTPTVVPAVPGGTTTAVTRYYGSPTLRAVGDTIYFNRETNETALDGIYSFKKGDAAPKQIVQADSVQGLVVDTDAIYYSVQNVGGIWKAPLTGGAGVKISDDPVSRIVGQDAQFVYSISSSCCAGNIYKVIK